MDAEEQRTIGGIVPFKLDLDAERRADQELELINVYMDWGLEFDLEDVACSASGRTAGSSDEVDDVTDGDAGGERKGISVLKSVEMLRRRESASSGGSVEEVVLDRDRGWRGRVVLFDAGREVLREVDAAGSNEVLDGRGMVVFEEDDDEALERTIDELNWWEEQRFREWRYEELQTSDVLEDDEALDALVDEMNQVEERLETEERMRVPRTMAIATALSLREGACVPASMSQQECENDLRDVLLILDQFSHHDLNDRTKTSASFRAVDDFVAAIKHKAHWALHGTCDGLAYHLDPDWVGQFLTTLYKIADLQVTSATSLSAAYPSQGMLSDPMMWKVWVTQQLQRLWKERYAHGLKRERRILDRTETEAMLVDNSQRLALVRSVRSQLQTKVLEDSKKDILEGIKNQCSWGVNETVQEIQSLYTRHKALRKLLLKGSGVIPNELLLEMIKKAEKSALNSRVHGQRRTGYSIC